MGLFDYEYGGQKKSIFGLLSNLAKTAKNNPANKATMEGLFGLAGIVPGVGDVASVAEAKYRYNEGDMLGAGLAGLGALPLVPNVAGMFIGKGAKTWDVLANAKAMEMEKAGVDPKVIWKETGNWKAPDWKWRQEIPDNAAALSKGRLPTKYIEGYGNVPAWKVGDVLKHDDLYLSYPNTSSIESSFNSSIDGAQYTENPYDWISYSKSTYQSPIKDSSALNRETESSIFYSRPEVKKYYDDLEKLGTNFTDDEFYKVFNPEIDNEAQRLAKSWFDNRNNSSLGYTLGGGSDEAKSITLHELQHAIQQREGWASGGSPDMFYLDETFPKFAKSEELAKSRGLDWENLPKRDKHAITNEVLNDHYRRLAGEAEARATQARMNMDMPTRLNTFPADSYDVPLDQLIIRGLLK